MNARLLPLRQPGALPLTHLHIDPFFLAALPGRFGGHGTLLHVNIDPQDPSASHHDVAYYGSMAAVWHYIRAWVVPPLQGRCLAQSRIAPQVVELIRITLLTLLSAS